MNTLTRNALAVALLGTLGGMVPMAGAQQLPAVTSPAGFPDTPASDPNAWRNVVPEPGVVVGRGGMPPTYVQPLYVQPAYAAPVYVAPPVYGYGYGYAPFIAPIGLSLSLGYSRGWGGGWRHWR